MMERHFEHVLENLKSDLMGMAGLVEEQLDAAYSALFDDNLDLAQRVVARDGEVDGWDTRIENECQEIFAVVQPVATDLRLLMAALKINGQLERIGDIAVNIAERVRVLSGYREFLRATRLQEMAEIARIMVRDSLEAIIHNNSTVAKRVLESDDVVDALDRQIFQQLVREMKADHRVIEPASHIMILSRHLERLGDHATNIAEDVIFLVEAKFVKHHAFNTPGRQG